MKKIILSLMCAAFLAACNNQKQPVETTAIAEAQETAAVDTANAPVFKFEKEVYDFGLVNEGEKVTYDFKFKNTGNSPLIISSATASCGCTVPDYPKQPIAPGEEGVISVVFNSEGRPGVQNKIVTVTANTIPSLTELSILGSVLAKEQIQTK